MAHTAFSYREWSPVVTALLELGCGRAGTASEQSPVAEPDSNRVEANAVIGDKLVEDVRADLQRRYRLDDAELRELGARLAALE